MNRLVQRCKTTLNRPLFSLVAVVLLVSHLLVGCALPRVSAEDRLFLNRSLEFLGEYQLPTQIANYRQVGGFSALTYDRQRDRFYAVSHEVSEQNPARFYTLKLNWNTAQADQTAIGAVEVAAVTDLKTEKGEAYPPDTIAPAGVVLSPQQSLFISSDHLDAAGVAPLLGEFDLTTGQLQRRLPIPNRYLPSQSTEDQPVGVQEHQAFSALALSSPSWNANLLEPFRIFAATAAPLVQDQTAEDTAYLSDRFLHYLIGDGPPVLIAEHVYPLDSAAGDARLDELLTIDQGGHFLSLEHSGSNGSNHARIYQLAMGSATDTSSLASLATAEGIEPIRKQLLFDLSDLGIPLGDLQGMTLGPRLPDGSQSLLLVSNNHLEADQPTQFLLFRLNNAS